MPTARSDKSYLVGQVQEASRPEALGHLELGRGLEQEDALGAALVDHVVHLGVLRVQKSQVRPLPLAPLHQVQRFLQLVQHRQGEEVYLGEVGVGHAVLVPVHYVPTRHGALPHRDHAGDGGVAQHHAADVLAQAPGSVHQLGSHLQEVAPAGGVHPVPEGGNPQHLLPQVRAVVGVYLFREEPQVLLRQPQSLAQVLDDALHRVGGYGPGQDGVVRPEATVYPLYQLVPEAAREVQVYVRQEGCVLGDEPLQSEIPPEGVDVAYADEVSHQHMPPRSRAPCPVASPPTGSPGGPAPSPP